MTIYNWLSLFGIPSIIAGLLTFVKLQIAQNKAMRLGIQAILRDRLIQAYRYHEDQGYADTDDRSNWENMYTQYHALGGNGVMEDIRHKFLNLPTKPPAHGSGAIS